MLARLAHALPLLVLLMPQSAIEAAEPDAKILANTCFSCHGPDGRSAGAMPSIAGKDRTYIEQVLRAYRDDRMTGTVMNRIAKGFSPAEIALLAQFFSTRSGG